MRSVGWLCAVPVTTCIIFLLVFPSTRTAPLVDGFTVAHIFFVWWLYIAPLFTFAAFALLLWKLWMETVSRRAKIQAWLAVLFAAGCNILAAVIMLRGVYR